MNGDEVAVVVFAFFLMPKKHFANVSFSFSQLSGCTYLGTRFRSGFLPLVLREIYFAYWWYILYVFACRSSVLWPRI